jgi:hypothetical protein
LPISIWDGTDTFESPNSFTTKENAARKVGVATAVGFLGDFMAELLSADFAAIFS